MELLVAVRACQDKDADLLFTTAEEEDYFVKDFAKTDYLWLGMKREAPDESWKLLNGKEATFNKIVGYYYGNHDPWTEDSCVQINLVEKKWYSIDCNDLAGFVCKRPLFN